MRVLSGKSFDGAYGALTLHADGSYTYVANSDIDGLDENEVVYDQFNYTAQDASGDSDIGVITITINGVNSNTPPTVETAAVDPSIDEAVDASSQDLLASGTITFADDNDADLTISGAASSIVTTGTGVSIPSIAMQIALEEQSRLQTMVIIRQRGSWTRQALIWTSLTKAKPSPWNMQLRRKTTTAKQLQTMSL